MFKSLPTVLAVKLILAFLADKTSQNAYSARESGQGGTASGFSDTEALAVLPKRNYIETFTFWTFYFGHFCFPF